MWLVPTIKQGYVDHTFYNTDSVLKTMEMLLGVTPLNQYDAIATAIVAPFDVAPNNSTPFNAIAASMDIMCSKGTALLAKKSNPMHKWVVESAKMNFDVPDSAPSAELNEILWKSVKGSQSKMPVPRHGLLTVDTDKD
jgi:hypothetical protein